jgi:DNA-binding Xre family transcriptional regulator
MMMEWRLSEALRQRGIQNASQLQEALNLELGIDISRQALHKLLMRPPASLRLETAQILCNLLQVPLERILTIQPEHPLSRHGQIIKPFAKESFPESTLFSDPGQFF